ncbi:MAG: CNNM domain-containing protein [Acidobacteriota bacterium]
MILLVAYVAFALAVSFLCSILEAALLSVREGELENRRENGEVAAGQLLDLKRERIDDAISAILILNTIAHTLGVAGSSVQAGRVFPDQPFFLNAVFPAILTLLILVGTEIIPKTLGTVHASTLAAPVAKTLIALIFLMKPLLVITRLITGALTSHEKAPISRGELAAIVTAASRQGTLDRGESRILANILRFREIQISDVMTPRTVATMVQADTDLETFLTSPDLRFYSRLPIYETTRDHVIGYVLQREVLAAAVSATAEERGALHVKTFQRDALFLNGDLGVDAALRRMTEEQQHLAMVADEYGGVSGLVTLEDLLETVLGIEIVDESDRVADLRAEAMALRERRLRQRGIGRVEEYGANEG